MDQKPDKKKLLIVDSYALIYRAYHAVPTLTSKGRNVNATYGFFSIFLKIFNKYNPDYIVCTFDSQTSTIIKKNKFSWYKSNREKVPDDLIPQFDYVKDILNSFDISVIESIDYEADDIVASIVKIFKKELDLEIYIITGDKDLIQLVNKGVNVIIPGKSFSDPREITINNVEEFLGFKSKYLLSYKSLKGDPSDNIPGVPGIGDKTAKDLILEFGDLEDIYKNVDKIKKDNLRNKLLNNKELAYDSLEAAKLNYDIHINESISDLGIKFNYSNIISKLKDFDFYSLISKYFPDFNGINTLENNKIQDNIYSDYEISTLDNKNLDKFRSKTTTNSKLFFHINFDHITNKIFDIYFKVDNKLIFYFNDFNNKEIIDELKQIFSNKDIEKICFNVKEYLTLLYNIGIKLEDSYFDINLAYFILKNKNLALKSIVFEIFNVEIGNYEELTLKGKFSLFDISKKSIKDLSILNCIYIEKLYIKFTQQLDTDINLKNIYYNIDLPLIKVLFVIEKNGIKLDTTYMIDFNDHLKDKIANIEEKIYSISGSKFNISSSVQLSNFLYHDLKLPIFKKLKSGIFPTDELTLSNLSLEHPVINLIRKYKELKKIETTYTLSLVKLVDEFSRLHTTYNITGVSTGRLSSKNPNLQNIPNKTDLGKDIRRAFIADKGKMFISFDYSQIELRIMAHYSNDKTMKDAFINNIDIHTYTASKIFNKKDSEVTREERSRAKTINFGIIYGLSSYGLSQQLSISRSEATNFIDQYFNTFPSIKEYYQYIDDFVEKNGFVETLFGRKRYFEIFSNSYVMKNQIFREAINMPIQGTSADIIKISMNTIYNDETINSLNANIILQIHDELVFEVPESIVIKDFIEKISNIMTNFNEISVPLIVDSKYGPNLKELKKYE